MRHAAAVVHTIILPLVFVGCSSTEPPLAPAQTASGFRGGVNSSVPVSAPSVDVDANDVGDLYRKLLHPQYAGHTLRLQGHYVLSAAAGTAAVAELLSVDGIPQGQLDPVAVDAILVGYIDLGDRHLEGQNRVEFADNIASAVRVDAVAGETIIDGNGLAASGLTVDHYLLPDVKFMENRSLVRARRGNAIQGVTLRWKRLGPGIFQQAVSVEGLGSRIEECKFEGPQINAAILVYARGKDVVGATVSADIIGNIGDASMNMAFLIGSTLFTRDAHTAIHLRGNDTRHRVIFHQPASEKGFVTVTSESNRYIATAAANGAAFVVRGGLGAAMYTHAIANRTEVASNNDRFEGAGVGVMVRGGEAGGVNHAIGNVAAMTLIAPHFEGTTIDVAGLRGAGDNNLAWLLVRHANTNPGAVVIASHTLGTGMNNRVELAGSRAAWNVTNVGLLAPAVEFFAAGR